MILYYRHKTTRQYGMIVQIYTSKNAETHAEVELCEFQESGDIIVTAATYTKDRAHPKGEQISEADFLQVWERWLKLWPALAGQKLCPCGCGKTVTPGRSIYFDPKSCKVRASRLKARTAQISNPEVADVAPQLGSNQLVAPKHPQDPEVKPPSLTEVQRAENAEVDEEIKRRLLVRDRMRWEEKVLAVLKDQGRKTELVNIRINVKGGIDHPNEVRNAVSRLVKRGLVLKEMGFNEHLYYLPKTGKDQGKMEEKLGKDDGQMRKNGNPEVAPSRISKAVIDRGRSLTSQVLELLKAPIEPMLVAKAIYGDSQKEKWNSVRSTINILYLKGSIGRRRKDGTAMTYEYAVRAYWETQGITVDYHQYPSK